MKMRTPHLLIAVAYLVHAAAWFLPFESLGVTFPYGLPGWQAFRVAASAVWPYDLILGFDQWYRAVLATISAATMVLFVLGTWWVVVTRSRRICRVSAWIATFAFVINAHWLLPFHSERLDLRIGYFLWWGSFLLLAIGLFRSSHSKDSC